MAINEVYYHDRPDQRVQLIDLKLNSDSIGYFLSATYRIEDGNSVRELHIPKIALKVNKQRVGVQVDTMPFGERVADIGFGVCDLRHNGSEVYFTETVISEKAHEMTLDEIEKKLGYKVKIVNKKDDI